MYSNQFAGMYTELYNILKGKTGCEDQEPEGQSYTQVDRLIYNE